MPRFEERFVNQVQQAVDIVQIVGQYVALTQRGKELVGLCPFHADHRPSMYVSPAKQIFKCFACGAGGDVFGFLMQMHKVTFPEALRDLAGRAGIAVPAGDDRSGPTDTSLSQEALLKATGFAREFFRRQLQGPAGRAALDYARSRQLSDESIERFGLGYAPDSWDALRTAAHQEGFTDRQLLAAGLLVGHDDREGGYDRFRNRLMFPIHDVTGRVIAFGGRALAPQERAKYLNSPETVLFDKSANLYALNWAHAAIAQAKRAVVVEGYLDALMPHQAGVETVVATLGTSLTDRHVRLLARYAREVVVVFDSDTAGRAATERAIELFLSQRLNVRVAAVPSEGAVKDPCDYVLAAGGEAFAALLEGAPDALEHAWATRSAAYRAAATLSEKRQIVTEFLTLVVSSSAFGAIDVLRQGLLAAHLAELVGLSPADVADEIRRLAPTLRRGGAAPAPPPADPAEMDRAEQWLLAAVIDQPALFDQAAERIDPAMFAPGPLRTLAEALWKLGLAGRLDLPSLLRAGGDDPTWGPRVTDLQAMGERMGNHQALLAEMIGEFERRSGRRQWEQLKAAGDGDEAAMLRHLADRARQPDRRRRPRL